MRAELSKRRTRVLGAGLALACAAVISANAQEKDHTTKPWVAMKRLETTEEVKRLPNDAQMAMACSKCKAIVVSTKRQLTTKPSGGTVEEFMTVDPCPGCGGKMVVRGDKQTQMVHTCSKCGDHSAFCCAVVDDGKAAKGAEKK